MFAALSDGSVISPANHGKQALRAYRKAQRAVARKQRGSANRRKAVRRVIRLHQRVANARKDFLHQHSTTIAKNHAMVVVEALQVRAMSASASGTAQEPGRMVRQKAGLDRAILDQGWRMFRIMLAYKLTERGRQAGGGPCGLYQPNLFSLRCGERRQSSRSGAVRMHPLRPYG